VVIFRCSFVHSVWYLKRVEGVVSCSHFVEFLHGLPHLCLVGLHIHGNSGSMLWLVAIALWYLNHWHLINVLFSLWFQGWYILPCGIWIIDIWETSCLLSGSKIGRYYLVVSVTWTSDKRLVFSLVPRLIDTALWYLYHWYLRSVLSSFLFH
jgi:hypothetical protein